MESHRAGLEECPGPINLGNALVGQGRWGDLGRIPKWDYVAAEVLKQQVAVTPRDLGVVAAVDPRAGPAPSPLPHWPSE